MGSTARWRMLAVSGAALMTASTVAACGSDDGTQINVYYAPEENFQKVIDQCNEQANGRYDVLAQPRNAEKGRDLLAKLAMRPSGAID